MEAENANLQYYYKLAFSIICQLIPDHDEPPRVKLHPAPSSAPARERGVGEKATGLPNAKAYARAQVHERCTGWIIRELWAG